MQGFKEEEARIAAAEAAGGANKIESSTQQFTINNDKSWYFYNTATKNAGKTSYLNSHTVRDVVFNFDFVVKTPPVAVQLLEVAKKKSGSAQPNRNKVAEITWEQVKTIAEDKMPDLNCFTVDSAMKMVAGTARSMGITVKGSFPENN